MSLTEEHLSELYLELENRADSRWFTNEWARTKIFKSCTKRKSSEYIRAMMDYGWLKEMRLAALEGKKAWKCIK